MMENSSDAWEVFGLLSMITKAGNLEVMYKAVKFYIAEQPELLNDLLAVLSSNVESTQQVSRSGVCVNHLATMIMTIACMGCMYL